MNKDKVTDKYREKMVIRPNEAARQLAALEKLRAERRHLQRRLEKAHEWLPLLKLDQPEVRGKEILEELYAKISEIRQLELEILRKHRPRKRRYFAPDPAIVGASADFLKVQQNCPSFIGGAVRYPTDFRVYKWSPPNGGYGPINGDIEWTFVREATRVERREGYDDDWFYAWPVTEADAIAFRAHCKTDDDTYDTMAAILCLEYRFPKPECDSTLTWNVHPSAVLPNGLEIGAVDGWAAVDIVIHEQPETSGFPEFESFEWTENKFWGYDFDYWSAKYWDIHGSFEVSAGSQSALYVGLAVQLFVSMLVQDGAIWSGDGTICTADCISSPEDHELWHEGCFQVRFDRGSSGPTVGRYLRGVGYEIIPR